MNDWLKTLKNAKKTCIQMGNLRKVHFALQGGKEMVEEYNMDTEVVTRRAWKMKTEIGSKEDWFIEVGDPEPTIVQTEVLIKENCSQPFISRRITKKNLEWRIRNLPYPVEVYTIEADTDKNVLIVRTSNKKYYKILNVPELERLNLSVEQRCVTFTHKFNTLVITYEKPTALIDCEKALFEEIRTLKPRKESEMDCKPS